MSNANLCYAANRALTRAGKVLFVKLRGNTA